MSFFGVTDVDMSFAASVAINNQYFCVFEACRNRFFVNFSQPPTRSGNGKKMLAIIHGANTSHNSVSWFVTAIGNAVPLEKEQGIIVARMGVPKFPFCFRRNRRVVFDVLLTPWLGALFVCA
jgi:hypothetical protein